MRVQNERCSQGTESRKNNILGEIIHERPNVVFICFLLPEAREAFIKQFSLLEASTGTLLAQLHSVAVTSNCSVSVVEEEGKDTKKDERSACRTLTETTLAVRTADKELKQATLDLDNMVGHSNVETFVSNIAFM